MKKTKFLAFLVLSLVLTSTVNAQPPGVEISLNDNTGISEITIAPCDTVVVGIYNTDGGNYGVFLSFYFYPSLVASARAT